MTTVDPRPGAARALVSRRRRPARAQPVAAFVALTKPRIIELLLVTTVPTMFLAARAVPPLRARRRHPGRRHAGGRQRQHPQLLPRPRHRRADAAHRAPPARHRRGVARGRRWSSGSCSASPRSACWRRPSTRCRRCSRSRRSCSTSSSTRCGSSAAPRRTSSGAAPPAACRCSSAGPRSPARSPGRPVVLFGVIFFWTPPHYWALSMRFRDDYAAAGVPMLPVVATGTRGRRGRSSLYSWAMVAVLAAAGAARRRRARSTPWSRSAARRLVPRRGAPAAARAARAGARQARARCGCSTCSITYLTVLFVAVAVDPFLPLLTRQPRRPVRRVAGSDRRVPDDAGCGGSGGRSARTSPCHGVPVTATTTPVTVERQQLAPSMCAADQRAGQRP